MSEHLPSSNEESTLKPQLSKGDIATECQTKVLIEEINAQQAIIADLEAEKQTLEKTIGKLLVENKELKKGLDEAISRTFTDSLTSLPNKSMLEHTFEKLQLVKTPEIERRQNVNEEKQCYIYFIDLDNFKQINDVYGHQAGDETLILIGNIISSSIRPEDLAVRLHGDEFVVLIKEPIYPVMAKEIADRMQERVKSEASANNANQETAKPKVGISIGVARVDFTQDLEVNLHRADQALYEVKKNGRGQTKIEGTELEE